MNNDCTGIQIGNKYEKYKVLERLGEGTSGSVYLVEDEHTQIRYAMKCYKSIAQGRKETEMLKSLHHPGIPKLTDCFVADAMYLLVMEYEEGESLEDALRAQDKTRQDVNSIRKYTGEERERIFHELVEIVAYMHTLPLPVVHGDLKPANVVLTGNSESSVNKPSAGGAGSVRLLDFGSANAYSRRREQRSSTVGYAAPELYAGLSMRQSDVYALGYILVYITTGRTPGYFTKHPTAAVLRRLGMSREYAAIAEKCTRRDPKDRYASAAILLDALDYIGLHNRLHRMAGRVRETILTDGGGVLAFYGLGRMFLVTGSEAGVAQATQSLQTVSARLAAAPMAGKLCLLIGCLMLISEILFESYRRNRYGEENTRLYSILLSRQQAPCEAVQKGV